MATPKKRQSHATVRMRRSHDRLDPVHLSTCPRCGNARKPHTVCGNCGVYRERVVFDVEAKEDAAGE